MCLYFRFDVCFDDYDEDLCVSLVNLVDVMLVFVCGLFVVLVVGM